MEGFLIRAAVVAIGLWLASKMGLVAFNSTGTLIAAALLLGVVNAFVRPIIIILTLPITLLTLGLFLLVINALMIMLVAWFLPGLPGRRLLVGGLRRDRREPDKLDHVGLDRPARPGRSHDRCAAPGSASAGERLLDLPELPELEGRHPKAAIQPHAGGPVLVHTRGLENGRHRVARRERDDGGIGFRRVKKDGRARRGREQA